MAGFQLINGSVSDQDPANFCTCVILNISVLNSQGGGWHIRLYLVRRETVSCSNLWSTLENEQMFLAADFDSFHRWAVKANRNHRTQKIYPISYNSDKIECAHEVFRFLSWKQRWLSWTGEGWHWHQTNYRAVWMGSCPKSLHWEWGSLPAPGIAWYPCRATHSPYWRNTGDGERRRKKKNTWISSTFTSKLPDFTYQSQEKMLCK